MTPRSFLPLFLALATEPAFAAGDACLPTVQQGWVRVPPAGMAMHAGYAQIHNPCTQAHAIVKAESPDYGHVELHETRHENGMSRMREIPRLPLPAGQTVRLERGGLHLMLMQPRRTLAAGDAVDIHLTLENGQTVRARLTAPASRD